MGQVSAVRFFGSLFKGVSEQLAVTVAGTAGLSAGGEVLDGLLTAARVELVGCCIVDLVLVLLLVALSSSSEEISTTIWADITDWRFLAWS